MQQTTRIKPDTCQAAIVRVIHEAGGQMMLRDLVDAVGAKYSSVFVYIEAKALVRRGIVYKETRRGLKWIALCEGIE